MIDSADPYEEAHGHTCRCPSNCAAAIAATDEGSSLVLLGAKGSLESTSC